jgi:hypothetical protein
MRVRNDGPAKIKGRRFGVKTQPASIPAEQGGEGKESGGLVT